MSCADGEERTEEFHRLAPSHTPHASTEFGFSTSCHTFVEVQGYPNVKLSNGQEPYKNDHPG